MRDGRGETPHDRRIRQPVGDPDYSAELPALLFRERAEVKRLRELLDRILNCCEKRCWLCDQCLAAARDLNRPRMKPAPALPGHDMPPAQREAFFSDLQDPYEVIEPSLRSSIETGR